MTRFTRSAAVAICGIASLGTLLASCSGSAPSLDEWKWRILYRDDGGDRREELYGIFRALDSDGAGDLSSLTVSIPSLGLEWVFDRGEWAELAGGEGSLWALPPMIPHQGAKLPDGLYTVRISDLAGRKAETTFRPLPDRPDPAEIEWPEARLDDGRISLSGPFPQGDLLLRDEEMKLLDRLSVVDGSVPDFGEALWWELWFGYGTESDTDGFGGGGDDSGPRGFRLGPYPVEVYSPEPTGD